LAGFQVTINGRFWVTAEECDPGYQRHEGIRPAAPQSSRTPDS